MKQTATDVASIIGLWPTTQVFADDLGLKYGASHARVMKIRKVIPRHHWQTIIEAAKRRGLPVTEQVLESAHAPVREAAE